MRLDPVACRLRLADSRSAHLATTDAHGQPHVVPVTHAVEDDVVVTGVDRKPKASTDLKRLRNIAENPRVSILCDHYEDDWTQLWWVRADGTATVEHDGATWQAAVGQLVAKYPQYRDQPPRGPMIVVRIARWTGWAYAPVGAQ